MVKGPPLYALSLIRFLKIFCFATRPRMHASDAYNALCDAQEFASQTLHQKALEQYSTVQ